MVLGKWHLGALRKVQKHGPIETGIHPCIGGLHQSGFVDKAEDGYILTEKGEIALNVYEDMSENHRGLLMRLYSAKTSGHKYTLDQAGPGTEIEDLIELELVAIYESDGRSLVRLTNAGLKFWETTVDVYRYTDPTRNGNAKKKVGEGLRALPKNKQASVPVPQDDEDEYIEDADIEDVMHAAGYTNGEIRNTMATIEDTPIGSDNTYSLHTASDHNCDTCINKQVLDMIANKYPVVAELRDTLLKQQELINKLKLD